MLGKRGLSLEYVQKISKSKHLLCDSVFREAFHIMCFKVLGQGWSVQVAVGLCFRKNLFLQKGRKNQLKLKH